MPLRPAKRYGTWPKPGVNGFMLALILAPFSCGFFADYDIKGKKKTQKEIKRHKVT
jgi:hypothetical protein